MARALSHINGNPTLHIPCRPNPSRPFPSLLPYRPMKVTMSLSNQPYWASINSDIEAHLKQAIPVREPLSVYEPIHHLTFAAPQTTAPALCVAACELVGGHRDHAIPAASAIHLMYAASFTHEHLPLTESVRPKSMISHVYDPNMELLLGDAMIPFGLELLARSDDPAQNQSDRVLRVMVEVTRVMGSQGMVYGQYYEVERYQSGNKDSSSHIKEIERISENYEGALHGCAAACGAILGGGSEEEIEKMRRYGLYMGKIQGMINRIGSNERGLIEKLVEELRNLASQELRGFNEAKVKAISTTFEFNFMYA
ncbi:Polyprenyl synthetase [Corchorus capsularis]|uniref:Polyprenyl synthetase n=1 Tax=Corchorus capsularis TaxID=210143 RepID=A0A1R3ILL4_COCAP|nr:Polyprenyl synthetase [Corchorus capsularis]